MFRPSSDKGVDSPGTGRQKSGLNLAVKVWDVVGDDLVAELLADQHHSPHIGEEQVLYDLIKYLRRKNIHGPHGNR